MSYLPRVDAATTAGWADLVDELDRWGEAGRVAELWWRDDDATAPTARLEALLRCADGVPLALAVIPALARPELAAALGAAPQVSVLQHGWRHADRAVEGKKSEYPATRPVAAVMAEITAGRARLAVLFGDCALPVFVPPWNRFAAEFLPLLAASGHAALSAMASRGERDLPAGLRALDVHLDLVAWHAGRGFIGEEAALGALVGQLQARRLAPAAAPQPIGILTHHLVSDLASTEFVARLVALTRTHPAARWAATGDLIR